MERHNSKDEIMRDNLRNILPERNMRAGAFVPFPPPENYKPPHEFLAELAAKNIKKKNEVCQNLKSHDSEQNVSKNVDLDVKGSKNVPLVEHSKKKNTKKPPKVYKKKQTTKNQIFLDDLSNEGFEIENIVRNPNYLKLIEDLVNCFTSNSTLSESELADLKLALFERTSSVFVELLNECIEKTFNKVLNTDVMKELKRKYPDSQDASCQTSN